jgi:hypothetical protein
MLAKIESINRNVGIFSMSARPDDLLMWSHYGDGHRGVCLVFTTADDKLFGCTLEQVRYQKEYPVFNAYEEVNRDYTRRYLTTKSDHWNYEEEWRILYYDNHGPRQFPAHELSGVIFGAKVSPADRKTLLGIIQKRNSHTTHYEARINSKRFGLDIVQLEY